MLRIDTSNEPNGETVVSLAGDFTGGYIPCVEDALTRALAAVPASISITLKHVALVDRAAMCYLRTLQRKNLALKDCPDYVVLWMEQEFRDCP